MISYHLKGFYYSRSCFSSVLTIRVFLEKSLSHSCLKIVDGLSFREEFCVDIRKTLKIA
ncbi:unnamed protein product [Moneuplotes crassus]|uniref:Uncharacterized protein n=1 Tax=Euplotes crassus TaxID=5936 RepID=A0AAD2CXG5_EUPCR|nr:unnamed protein product [Moneuplotes crassus]